MLLGSGHTQAHQYPLGMVYDEANLVRERVNGQIVTEAELVKLAILSLFSKKARSQFSKLSKQLNIEVQPRPGAFD